MAKTTFTPNLRVAEIFDDLDKLLEFCKDYGYRYNEGDLCNFKSYAWQQFNKFTQGKNTKNMWTDDLSRFTAK